MNCKKDSRGEITKRKTMILKNRLLKKYNRKIISMIYHSQQGGKQKIVLPRLWELSITFDSHLPPIFQSHMHLVNACSRMWATETKRARKAFFMPEVYELLEIYFWVIKKSTLLCSKANLCIHSALYWKLPCKYRMKLCFINSFCVSWWRGNLITL